jgi:hypothetical protein
MWILTIISSKALCTVSMDSLTQSEPTTDQKKVVSDSPFQDLKRRVEITRDARFQSNLRLERRNKSSYFIIALLSLFVIVLSLVPNIYELSPAGTQALLALSIINSVFVIITTFLEASGNFVHRGEQLHRSARKIAKVFNELMLLTPSERNDKDRIQALQRDYQSALDDCPFNHENMDYDLIKATKPSLFEGRIYRGNADWIFIRWRLLRYRISEYMWLAPHLIVFATTIIALYWIVFADGLGPTNLVGAFR